MLAFVAGLSVSHVDDGIGMATAVAALKAAMTRFLPWSRAASPTTTKRVSGPLGVSSRSRPRRALPLLAFCEGAVLPSCEDHPDHTPLLARPGSLSSSWS